MGNDPDTDLQRAQQLLDLGRAAQARELAASALAARPNSPVALRLLARCHMALGEHREAVRIARAAVAADPGAEYGFRILSMALRRIKHHREAADAAAEAVRLAPHEWRAFSALAQSLYRVNRGRALAAAEEARRLAPQNAEPHYLCGALLATLGYRQDEARAAYLRALEIDPQHLPSLNGLALLDERRWRFASARRGFRRALGADPQHHTVQRNLEALVLLRLWGLGWLAVIATLAVIAGRSGGPGRTRALAVGYEAVLLVLFAASAWSAKHGSDALGVRLLRRNRAASACKAVIATSAVLIAIAAVVPGIVEIGAYTAVRVSVTLLNVAVLLLLLALRRRSGGDPDAL
ncbi:tetratricopeptide repeat protein [Actinospica sp. MGRD01-02]|uniref:Tetratricopeptide repeat protein n=1 Tax=Actinospica acidithermotolerans TaxID=2828514 RepID=A0A941E6X2_9ACTN|nr:tetratricopeptide repeat protein [Actinospica acidithermotolerans]MBR7825048.1 tetratricopeptide repeat protein [Actinospica acidithermotolerans]